MRAILEGFGTDLSGAARVDKTNWLLGVSHVGARRQKRGGRDGTKGCYRTRENVTFAH